MDVEMANLDSFGDHRKVSGRLQELKSQQDKKGIEVMRINSQLRFGDRARESLYDAILPDGIYKGSGIGTKLAMSGDLFGGKRQAPLALSGGKQYLDRIALLFNPEYPNNHSDCSQPTSAATQGGGFLGSLF